MITTSLKTQNSVENLNFPPLNPDSKLETCRGRYEINLYRAHFRIHGAKYDHKMAYEDVNNFFLLEKPRLVVRAMGRGLSIEGGLDGRFPLLLCVWGTFGSSSPCVSSTSPAVSPAVSCRAEAQGVSVCHPSV
jgi:hypothetical protein